MSDKEFIDGFRVNKPHEKAPDFVIASGSFKVEELQKWLSTKQTEYVNFDIKLSKKGSYYAEVNNWQKDKSSAGVPGDEGAGAKEPAEFVDDDIPF
jgi:hypothetical protein